MNGTSETMPLAKTPPIAGRKWKPRLFTVAYFCFSAIAMIGWLAGLGWLTMSAARWLFS
jgi:hypothetical protein